MNIITSVKTKGTKKCGIIVIAATLVICCVMVICIDTVGYYMIPMATAVEDMDKVNETLANIYQLAQELKL